MDGAQGPLTLTPPGNPDIRGLTADSRDVRPGFLFAALAGSRADGRGFVDDAVARGAVAVLTDDPARFAAAIDQIALAYSFKAKDKAADVFDASFLPEAAER